MQKILQYFHHIHHKSGCHETHHCGGKHNKKASKLDYIIKHCLCGKHSISKEEAVGHDFEGRETIVGSFKRCPHGGWHIEDGKVKK